MGDFSNLLRKTVAEPESKPVSKLPSVCSSPRATGAGLFIGMGNKASPVRMVMSEDQSFSRPSIDYRDVFGGPPRYISSIFYPQAGTLPTLDDVITMKCRPPVKHPPSPVFEFPVFGEDPQPVYDAGPISAIFGGSRQAGMLSSIPASHSVFQHSSPVQPSAYYRHPSRDEAPPAARSPISRPDPGFGARKSSSSFSSAGLADPKGSVSPFKSIINAPIGSNLPSSPFLVGRPNHLRQPIDSTSDGNSRVPASSDVDDVFGGFPQRKYYHIQFNNNNPAFPLKGGSSHKDSSLGHRLRESLPSLFDKTDVQGSTDAAFHSSPISPDEQDLLSDYIEIKVDERNEVLSSQKPEEESQKVWTLATDLDARSCLSVKSSDARKLHTSFSQFPPSQVKAKSWKDWASEIPKSHPLSAYEPHRKGRIQSDSSGSCDKEGYRNTEPFYAYVKGWVDATTLGISDQKREKNAPEQNFSRASSEAFAFGDKIKNLSGEENFELDDKELQMLLAKAWKVNEQRERERKIANERREAYIKEKELQLKVLRKLSNSRTMTCKGHQKGQAESRIIESDVDGRECQDCEQNAARSPTSKAVNLIEKIKTTASILPSCIMESDFDSTKAGNMTSKKQQSDDLLVSVEMRESTTGAQDSMQLAEDEPSENDVDGTRGSDILEQISMQCGVEEELSSGDGAEGSNFVRFQEVEGETTERRSLRWKRHVEASKRAAKALEAKQQRDARVQHELEEKQQLAKSLDHMVKRWASGKEGNLRALLSNLQHVLWPESGWQPIPLTNLIEGIDVKKAYRKATLFVHPDKLQQKGATHKQKYIAERVFDILQEAWKIFNLQELF